MAEFHGVISISLNITQDNLYGFFPSIARNPSYISPRIHDRKNMRNYSNTAKKQLVCEITYR